MYDYVIVHGSFGHQYENWFPWLFQKLTDAGKNVLAPQFPAGKGVQNYENWATVLDAYKDQLSPNTSFIGHSLGPAFIVDYIIDKGIQAKSLFLVAPFYSTINIPEFDEVNTPFFKEKQFKTENLRLFVKKTIFYVSTTDPYVPNHLSLEFAERVGATVKLVEDAGHFNIAAGYSKFEQLYEDMIADE